MSRELLLNPSCSELVTFLGVVEPEEVQQVLNNICQKFNYRLKLIPSDFDIVNSPGILVDVSRVSVNKDVKVLTFSGMIIDPSNANLERALDERLISRDYFLKHKDDQKRLRDLVSFVSNRSLKSDVTISLAILDTANVPVNIQFQICDGYDDTVGLSLQSSESSSISEFPILGNVYLMDPEKYKYMAFEGGSTSDFEEWLRYKISHNDREIDSWMKNKNPEEYYIRGFAFKTDE